MNDKRRSFFLRIRQFIASEFFLRIRQFTGGKAQTRTKKYAKMHDNDEIRKTKFLNWQLSTITVIFDRTTSD